MSEPANSFAEWRCTQCGRVRLEETRERGTVTQWPEGWRVDTSGTFARVVCPKCAQKEKSKCSD